MAEPTTDHIDALLSELDEIAREYDSYDYGLPMHDDPSRDRMREAVRKLTRALGVVASDEPKEKRNA